MPAWTTEPFRFSFAARRGGTVAGNARRELEAQSGTKVSTPDNLKALSKGKI